MKITLLLCAIATFSSCPSNQSTPKSEPTSKNSPGSSTGGGSLTTSMDSPIIISDGSTHIHYQTFHMMNDTGDVPHIVVKDANFLATTLTCDTNGVTCTAGTTTVTSITLAVNWSLELASSDSLNNTIKVVNLSSPDNNKILANFHRNLVDPEPEQMFASTFPTYLDLNVGNLPLKTGTFTNGTGGSPANVSIVCNSSPCVMRIHYVCQVSTGC